MKHLLTTLLLFSIAACDKVAEITQPSPETILNEYLTAFTEGDYTTAYSKLSSVDQAYKSLSKYKLSFANESPLAEVLLGNLTYEIQSITSTGNSAVATVKQTMPDGAAIFKDLLGAAFSNAFSGDSDTEGVLEKALKEKYADGKLPMTTTTEEHNLVKEESGWRVFVDFKASEERVARNEKIKTMLDDAKELRKNKEYVRAVELYSEVLNEDEDNADADSGLKETETELAEQTIKQEYIKNVKLYDFEAKRIDTYSKKDVPAVRFTVKNEGDRTLNKVEVTVYFKDSKGDVIFEENYNPVFVSKYSIGDNKPLKPNYVKRKENGTYYTIKELGDEWKTGAAEAVVTDIEFAP